MSPTQLTTSETLNLAADLIEERGWAQGINGWPGSSRHDGELCMEGGIQAAMGWDGAEYGAALRECPAYLAVERYLGLEPPHQVYEFNDTNGRTQGEVVEVLRATALVEQTREAALADDMIALLSAGVAG